MVDSCILQSILYDTRGTLVAARSAINILLVSFSVCWFVSCGVIWWNFWRDEMVCVVLGGSIIELDSLTNKLTPRSARSSCFQSLGKGVVTAPIQVHYLVELT